MSNPFDPMAFSRNLIRLIEQSGIKQIDIVRALDVSKSTVSTWCTGLNIPRMNKVQALADLFDVNLSDLLEDKSNLNRESHQLMPVRIPILGRVRASIPISAIEDFIDYEEITGELAASGSFFALKIRGDSMEPKISDGDVVIVKQQPDATTGDIAVVLINNEDATIKRIKKRPEGLMLIPSNNAYEPMFYTNEEVAKLPVIVLGKVIELRAKF